jgi:hypothetical protein
MLSIKGFKQSKIKRYKNEIIKSDATHKQEQIEKKVIKNF